MFPYLLFARTNTTVLPKPRFQQHLRAVFKIESMVQGLQFEPCHFKTTGSGKGHVKEKQQQKLCFSQIFQWHNELDHTSVVTQVVGLLIEANSKNFGFIESVIRLSQVHRYTALHCYFFQSYTLQSQDILFSQILSLIRIQVTVS